MANTSRKSDRFSVEPDSTLNDLWQFSQRPDARFDPQAMNQALDYKKKIQKTVRQDDRFSFGHLLEGESPVIRQDEMSNAMKRRSANFNLQKSMQLLNEAVSTPSVKSRRTPQVLRHSNYTPRHVPSGSRFDVSGTLGLGTPGGSLIATPGSTMATLGDSVMDTSLQGTPVRSSYLSEYSTIPEEEATSSNVAVLLQEEPDINVSSGMYGDFMQCLNANRSEHQVFHLLEEYEKVCTDNVCLLKKLVTNAVPGQKRFVRTVDLYRNLNEEKKTWRLVHSLYRDRIETETKHQEESMMVDTIDKHQSEKDIVQNLYEQDADVRQTQLVIDWLERSAAEELEDCYDKVEFFTDKTGAWENTLHSLKRRQETSSYMSSERPIVTQLDPDAPLRQKCLLADLDVEDETRLLKNMFSCVRAGNLEEAQKICQKVGQSWRGGTLEGWRLFHDPNYNDESFDQKVQGNSYRDVWKAVCWRIAEEERLHVFERALYAAYSGNLKQLLPACDSWEDHLWAYCRVLVDTKVERELQMTYLMTRPREVLPKQYSDKQLTLESIFEEIQASPKENLKLQAKEKFHIIQKYIILKAEENLLEEMYEWSREEIYQMPPHLLRFMAHLVLFYRTIGIAVKDELCVGIIEAYVRYLTDEKQIPLVACYVSRLPEQMQLDCYARFLECITDTDSRRECLTLAGDFQLDVHSITKLVVENICSHEPPDINLDGDLPKEAITTQEDRVKIESIEWLVFDPEQRAEAMRQANAIMRTFIATCKLSAARDVFNKIPAGSLDIIYSLWQRKAGGAELCAEDDNAIREYLCHKAYLDAHDSFNDFFQHYHHARPVQPHVPAGANFTERVAHEQKEKQYEAELERWNHALQLQTKTTKEKIYNVLVFVNGGWMVDQREEAEGGDKKRFYQMKLLRQLCLPSLCMLLHQVLHTTQQYKECLQLADLIASEQYRLYTVFRKNELQKLLEKLRESSVMLLDSNLDPLGHPLI